MSSTLSIKTLRTLISLTETVQSQLAEVEATIGKLIEAADSETRGEKPTSAKRGRKPATKPVVTSKAPTAERAKRGGLQEVVLSGLQDAGDAGISVKDLAAKFGLNPSNLHVWLGTAGKKLPIEKAGRGLYRLSSGVVAKTPASSVVAVVESIVSKVTEKRAVRKAGRPKKS